MRWHKRGSKAFCPPSHSSLHNAKGKLPAELSCYKMPQPHRTKDESLLQIPRKPNHTDGQMWASRKPVTHWKWQRENRSNLKKWKPTEKGQTNMQPSTWKAPREVCETPTTCFVHTGTVLRAQLEVSAMCKQNSLHSWTSISTPRACNAPIWVGFYQHIPNPYVSTQQASLVFHYQRCQPTANSKVYSLNTRYRAEGCNIRMSKLFG